MLEVANTAAAQQQVAALKARAPMAIQDAQVGWRAGAQPLRHEAMGAVWLGGSCPRLHAVLHLHSHQPAPVLPPRPRPPQAYFMLRQQQALVLSALMVWGDTFRMDVLGKEGEPPRRPCRGGTAPAQLSC